jgi:hypothetical protein
MGMREEGKHHPASSPLPHARLCLSHTELRNHYNISCPFSKFLYLFLARVIRISTFSFSSVTNFSPPDFPFARRLPSTSALQLHGKTTKAPYSSPTCFRLSSTCS